MALNTLAISEGATCSIAGGTSKTFGPGGTQIKGGLQVIDKSVADIRTRPLWNFRYVPAVLQKDKSWSFEKKIMTCVIPQVNADGITQEFPAIEITINHPVAYTTTQIDEICNRAAQGLFDSDASDFRRYGALG